MEYNTFLKAFKKLTEQTTRYTPPNVQGDRGDYQDNYDRYVDFPYVEDPTDYVTHRPMEQDDVDEQSAAGRNTGSPAHMKSKLASEQAAEPEIKPAEAGAEAGAGGDIEGGLPDDMAGGDMGIGGIGAGGIGMEQQEEPLTSSQVGRVYELKKIYSRLASVESYLSRATDQSILELRKYVAQSIDLFEVVMSNYPQFKENVDDIIVQFYEFLDIVYESIRKYYKTMQD